MRIRAAAFLTVTVVGQAGCGSAQPAAGPQQPRGARLFVQSCGACHRLAAAGTEGVAAKNFDKVHLSRALVLRTLAVPPKNMPANLLSGRDAQVVAAYLAAVAGR